MSLGLPDEAWDVWNDLKSSSASGVKHCGASCNFVEHSAGGWYVCMYKYKYTVYIYINNIHVIYTSLCIAFVGIRGSQD